MQATAAGPGHEVHALNACQRRPPAADRRAASLDARRHLSPRSGRTRLGCPRGNRSARRCVLATMNLRKPGRASVPRSHARQSWSTGRSCRDAADVTTSGIVAGPLPFCNSLPRRPGAARGRTPRCRRLSLAWLSRTLTTAPAGAATAWRSIAAAVLGASRFPVGAGLLLSCAPTTRESLLRAGPRRFLRSLTGQRGLRRDRSLPGPACGSLPLRLRLRSAAARYAVAAAARSF